MNGVSATTNQTAKTYTGSISSGAKFVATDSSNNEILSLSFPKAASYFYFNYATSFTITIDGSEITLSDAGDQNQESPGGQTPSSDQGPGGQTPLLIKVLVVKLLLLIKVLVVKLLLLIKVLEVKHPLLIKVLEVKLLLLIKALEAQPRLDKTIKILQVLRIHLIMIIHHIQPHQQIQIYQAKQYQVQLVEKVQYI